MGEMTIAELLGAVGNATAYTILIVSGGLVIRTLWNALNDERLERKAEREKMQADINALHKAALDQAGEYRKLSLERVVADNEQTRVNLRNVEVTAALVAKFDTLAANINSLAKAG